MAGDPMDEKVKWIKLTRYQISMKMKEFGIHVSRNIVRKIFLFFIPNKIIQIKKYFHLKFRQIYTS